MPMFYTPKPRQFHYRPLFYDPEREDWEALKAKYGLEDESTGTENGERKTENERKHTPQSQSDNSPSLGEHPITGNEDTDLEYFQRKVQAIEREERKEKQKMTIKDLFRKRERPQFHYVSRFDENGNLKETSTVQDKNIAVKKRINRRFNDEDMDGLKPVPAGKIMIYTLIVCILLYLIFA